MDATGRGRRRLCLFGTSLESTRRRSSLRQEQCCAQVPVQKYVFSALPSSLAHEGPPGYGREVDGRAIGEDCRTNDQAQLRAYSLISNTHGLRQAGNDSTPIHRDGRNAVRDQLTHVLRLRLHSHLRDRNLPHPHPDHLHLSQGEVLSDSAPSSLRQGYHPS